ncbi:MAG: aldolase/citrate lyase family protein, partial [Acidobacteriota bacterium]|nr:aldolase/citrate lyase family protein [Acidobacteriota bacterium]
MGDTGSGRHGEAGPVGDDVRSDVHVGVDLTDGGGIELELISRVEPYYGESIRAQVLAVLERLEVTDARVRVTDQGALPFVIEARTETAVRRAGGGTGGDARPGRTVALPPPSDRTRLRRSRLYLPGNEPKFMINAGLHRPDGIILDLEDSVHADVKDAARLVVRNALRGVDFGDAERMVRINQGPLGLEDLRIIAPESPDVILIPKVENLEVVVAVDRVLDEVRGADRRPVWLMPILESALGIEHAFGIARASKRVIALTLGLEDYTADLGVPKTQTGEESLFARMRVINAARAAGVQPIDSVYGDVADVEGLTTWARRSRALGFEGMGCVHPRQIEVVHRCFAPTPEEIERALA